MSEPRIIDLPADNGVEEFLDFEVVNENWSTYEVEDGSILKSKFVLLSAIAYGERDEENTRLSKFSTHTLYVVYSPPELRGTPEHNLSVEDLEEYVTERNLKFSQIKDSGLNAYKFEKRIIEVDHRVNHIDKTSKYNKDGMPAYVIRGKTMILGTSVPDNPVVVG